MLYIVGMGGGRGRMNTGGTKGLEAELQALSLDVPILPVPYEGAQRSRLFSYVLGKWPNLNGAADDAQKKLQSIGPSSWVYALYLVTKTLTPKLSLRALTTEDVVEEVLSCSEGALANLQQEILAKRKLPPLLSAELDRLSASHFFMRLLCDENAMMFLEDERHRKAVTDAFRFAFWKESVEYALITANAAAIITNARVAYEAEAEHPQDAYFQSFTHNEMKGLMSLWFSIRQNNQDKVQSWMRILRISPWCSMQTLLPMMQTWPLGLIMDPTLQGIVGLLRGLDRKEAAQRLWSHEKRMREYPMLLARCEPYLCNVPSQRALYEKVRRIKMEAIVINWDQSFEHGQELVHGILHDILERASKDRLVQKYLNSVLDDRGLRNSASKAASGLIRDTTLKLLGMVVSNSLFLPLFMSVVVYKTGFYKTVRPLVRFIMLKVLHEVLFF